jgi:PmbA protein
MKDMDFSRTNEIAIRAAKKLGVEDAVSLIVHVNKQMIRFANNSLTVANRINETELSVYLAKNKKRIVGSSSNPDPSSVKKFVENLFKPLPDLPSEPNYSPLPEMSYRYKPNTNGYDKRIGELENKISEFAQEAIEASKKAGATRSAGTIEASLVSYYILTSSGTEGHDKRSSILLNIRSFADHEASGHGLSCSSDLTKFNPQEAGRRAGEQSKRMINSKQPEEGTYQILMSPTVASNLVSLIGSFSSAFSVDAGVSYLAGKLNTKVSSESFTLKDHGYIQDCLGGGSFDSEGLPTQSTTIIENGILRSYLHNLTTAKKFGTVSTANAGWIEPNPWNLEVRPGDSDYTEMVKEMKRGIILTSNWYTRFTNYRSGEFSTVPRDGTYIVRNGSIKEPLRGLRISDMLERLFSSVQLMSSEREWIEWWEVDVPTLCPWILVDGVRVTRAYS